MSFSTQTTPPRRPATFIMNNTIVKHGYLALTQNCLFSRQKCDFGPRMKRKISYALENSGFEKYVLLRTYILHNADLTEHRVNVM